MHGPVATVLGRAFVSLLCVTGSHDRRLFCPDENAQRIEFKMIVDYDVIAVREKVVTRF